MNYPLDYAIMATVRAINKQVLDLAIRYSNKTFHKNENVLEFICNNVINPVVLKDINIVAGQVKTIVLKPAWIEETSPDHEGYAGDDGPWTVWRIPPEARDNKPISQVMHVQFPYVTYQSSGIANADVASGGYSLVDQIDNVLNSYTLSTPRNHPVVTLLSGDLVKITPSQYTRQFWLLTCRINYDETFMNIHDASIPILGEMVALATKNWIYNQLYVDIDRAYVETGMDIATLKEIIGEYKDALNLYKEELLKFRGASSLDPEYRRRLYYFLL